MTDTRPLPPYGIAVCGRCKRSIRWTVTENGKRLPVDPEPDPAGNIVAYLTDTQTWRSRGLRQGEQPAHIERAFMPHFATCGRHPDTPHEPAPRTPEAQIVGLTSCNQPLSPTAPDGQVRILPWICPSCDGTGRWSSEGERCMMCVGGGLVDEDDLDEWPREDLRPAPRPPAVMAKPCADCAFRPHSPEQESGQAETIAAQGIPFWCHHGLHDTGRVYSPTAVIGRMPLGAMLCAGWWASATEQPLPNRDYRDPPERDR